MFGKEVQALAVVALSFLRVRSTNTKDVEEFPHAYWHR